LSVWQLAAARRVVKCEVDRDENALARQHHCARSAAPAVSQAVQGLDVLARAARASRTRSSSQSGMSESPGAALGVAQDRKLPIGFEVDPLDGAELGEARAPGRVRSARSDRPQAPLHVGERGVLGGHAGCAAPMQLSCRVCIDRRVHGVRVVAARCAQLADGARQAVQPSQPRRGGLARGLEPQNQTRVIERPPCASLYAAPVTMLGGNDRGCSAAARNARARAACTAAQPCCSERASRTSHLARPAADAGK
jgi:hypothetical protein